MSSFISFLQSLPPEVILLLEYLVCCLTLLFFVRYFGSAGLISYVALAVIIANIQVTKTAFFGFLHFPVALGTIVFSSTFLACDILTEFYGAVKARQAIWMGFAASLFITVIMTLTVGIKPVPTCLGTYPGAHQGMLVLFSPAPALLCASLVSWIISQYADIRIFQAIRHITGKRWLGLRTFVASLASAFLDNVVFSTLAWVIFASNPVSMDQLLYTYILGTYAFRVIVTVVQTPVMYGARLLLKKGSNHDQS